ncbi:MAG: GtrA family protein [Oscillospiraceae bacterium]|nr:GtrA family protein [Candidatus Equicaccousia limihippi]
MKTNKDKPQGGIKSLWQNKRAVVFDFLKYVLVGAIATAVEYGIFTLLIFALGKPYYEIATVVGYIVSTFFNWLFGRIILFKTSNKPLFKEILEIYLASVAGLLMSMGIMWLFVDLA